MKKCLFLWGVLFLTGFSYAQDSKDPDFTRFRENVAIYGTFTRNLDAKTYVKEIKLVSFSADYKLPEGFGIKGVTVSDDGRQYDLVAGDGIYTSVEKYEITEKQAGNPVGVSVPVTDKIIVDLSFKQEVQLNEVVNDFKIKIKCKFSKCGCPCQTFTCYACIHYGWSCIAVEYCEVEVEW